MKSFTLTPSTPTRRIFIYKQYCSIKIEGSDFANTQLIVEQRDNDGLWTPCSIPTINTDQEWFTVTSATRRQGLRFSVVGSGAYSIPIQVKQSTDAEYNFLTTVNDPNVASLDSDGKVPASELPSYVDDVLEYADLASFPGTGETGKIYVALDSGLVYRWSGSTYVQIAAGDHSHSNLAVLDATTEPFTTTDLNNINNNTANNHTHANQTILDATTANFTSAAAFKLNDIEDEATKGGTKQDDTTNAIIPRLDTKIDSVAGNARGNEALDTQIIRNAATQVASGARSIILGGFNNTASNAQSAVVSASSSTASGSGAVVVGGDNNTSSGLNSEVLGSQNSTASGIGSSVVGGSNCNVSGNWGMTVGGLNHQITQPRGGILAGNDNVVNHANSVILGGSNITTDATNTAFVPSLNIGGGFKMPTGATAGYVLTTDGNGVGSWQEVAQPVGGASWVYNSSGYSDQIHGDIPDNWRNIAAKTADQLVVIGTSCTSIGSMAFVGHNNADGGLVIPDSVTSLGTFAFQSYAQAGTIKGELYLSKNLTRIEMGVFQIAKFIGELNLPAGLTYIGSNGFSSGTYTGDLTIPPLVTEIGNNSFYGNASLGSKLTLPESLTTIGSQSFRDCTGITTIDCFTTKTALDVSDTLLGSGVTTIHARATDSTWTAGSGQTIGGKTDITVIKDL